MHSFAPFANLKIIFKVLHFLILGQFLALFNSFYKIFRKSARILPIFRQIDEGESLAGRGRAPPLGKRPRTPAGRARSSPPRRTGIRTLRIINGILLFAYEVTMSYESYAFRYVICAKMHHFSFSGEGRTKRFIHSFVRWTPFSVFDI